MWIFRSHRNASLVSDFLKSLRLRFRNRVIRYFLHSRFRQTEKIFSVLDVDQIMATLERVLKRRLSYKKSPNEIHVFLKG